MLKGSYTLEGVRGLVDQGGSARKSAVQALIKGVGGKLESVYFAFGSTDVFVIADLPGNEAAAAVALAVAASGGVTVETTVLLTPQEMDAATQQPVTYRPPGS